MADKIPQPGTPIKVGQCDGFVLGIAQVEVGFWDDGTWMTEMLPLAAFSVPPPPSKGKTLLKFPDGGAA